MSKSIFMLLAAGVAMTACEKNAVQPIDDPELGNGANVKFFNFAVGSPNVNFFVNDKKATGVSSTVCSILTDENRQQCLSTGGESTAGVAFGGAGNGANAYYSDVAPGQAKITGNISAATDKNLAIASAQTTLEAGKFYSYYLSGTYSTATKSADAFIVEDVLPPVDFNVAYVRFVNASSTTQPMTLYLKSPVVAGAEIEIPGLVAYKSASQFFAVPAPFTYNLATRAAGSSTEVFTRTGVTFSQGRVYTITARGSTSPASGMLLDNTANR
jgi:hypothetical protein